MPERKPHFSTLESYEEMPIFIPVDIMDDMVKLVVRKLSGSAGIGGMDSEALQFWLQKFGDTSKTLRIIVEYFAEWLANQSPPWDAYWVFISCRLVSLDKQTSVCLLDIGKPRADIIYMSLEVYPQNNHLRPC